MSLLLPELLFIQRKPLSQIQQVHFINIIKIFLSTNFFWNFNLADQEKKIPSSDPWPGLVVGSLNNWRPDQFLQHNWVEGQRGIHSCITGVRQEDLAVLKSVPVKLQLMSFNFKAYLGHRRSSLLQQYHVIIILTAYRAMEPSLPNYAIGPLTIQGGSSVLWQISFLIFLSV